MPKLISVSLLICVIFTGVNSYKILGIFPVASRSHYYVGHALLKGLANQGHEVTVISPFRVKTPIPNYTEVFLEDSWDLFRQDMAKSNFVDFNTLYFWDMIFKYFEVGDKMLNWTITSKNFQKFLKTDQHFDVIVAEMVMCDALLGFGQHFNAPIIGTSAFGASKWTTDLVGSPNFASYVPHQTALYSDRMTFWERMYNSMTFWFEDIVYSLYYLPRQQRMMEQIFPNTTNWPTLNEIRYNVSLVLLNTHTTLGTARPYAPNMIEVGGMQINREYNPLPAKMKAFLDGAKHGAIFVSLGSNVLISKLPEKDKSAILNAFADYPKVRLLIKCDDPLVVPSHDPSDVLVDAWYPQEAVLAHPNLKVFVTHGGLLSTTESVYFGKPVIGIPFFFDQHLNMKIAEDNGFGLSVPYEQITLLKLQLAVHKLLEDTSYAEKAKITSDRYRDQIATPLEIGMHWVKHIAKNKGAPHLRSVAVDLTFYELYNLDVWAFVLLAVCSSGYFMVTFLKWIISSCYVMDRTKQKKH